MKVAFFLCFNQSYLHTILVNFILHKKNNSDFEFSNKKKTKIPLKRRKNGLSMVIKQNLISKE